MANEFNLKGIQDMLSTAASEAMGEVLKDVGGEVAEILEEALTGKDVTGSLEAAKNTISTQANLDEIKKTAITSFLGYLKEKLGIEDKEPEEKTEQEKTSTTRLTTTPLKEDQITPITEPVASIDFAAAENVLTQSRDILKEHKVRRNAEGHLMMPNRENDQLCVRNSVAFLEDYLADELAQIEYNHGSRNTPQAMADVARLIEKHKIRSASCYTGALIAGKMMHLGEGGNIINAVKVISEKPYRMEAIQDQLHNTVHLKAGQHGIMPGSSTGGHNFRTLNDVTLTQDKETILYTIEQRNSKTPIKIVTRRLKAHDIMRQRTATMVSSSTEALA